MHDSPDIVLYLDEHSELSSYSSLVSVNWILVITPDLNSPLTSWAVCEAPTEFNVPTTNCYWSLLRFFGHCQPLHGLHPFMVMPFNLSVKQVTEFQPRSPSCLAGLCCWNSAWSVLIELANPTEWDHLSPIFFFISAAVSTEVQGILAWGARTCQATWLVAVCHRSLYPGMKIHP